MCDFHFTSGAKNGSKTIIAHLNAVHSDVPTGTMKKTLIENDSESYKYDEETSRNKIDISIKNQDDATDTKMSVEIIEDKVVIDQCYMCNTYWKINEIKSHFCHEHGRYLYKYHGPKRNHECPKCKVLLPKPIQDMASHACIEYFENRTLVRPLQNLLVILKNTC